MGQEGKPGDSAKRRLLRSEASNDAHRPAPVHRRLGPLASLRWRPRLQHLSQPALNSTPVKPRRLSVPVSMRRHWLRRHPVSTHEDGVGAPILDNSALLDESGRTRKYTPSRIQVAPQQRRRAQQLHEGPADADEAPTDGVAMVADHSERRRTGTPYYQPTRSLKGIPNQVQGH